MLEAGWSRAAVKLALRILEESGYLLVKRHANMGQSSEYWLTFPEGSPQNHPPVTTEPPGGHDVTTPGSDRTTPGHHMAGGGSPQTPENPPFNPPIKTLSNTPEESGVFKLFKNERGPGELTNVAWVDEEYLKDSIAYKMVTMDEARAWRAMQ